MKPPNRQHNKHDHIVAEKVKIQGGGQDGQDKVQLNVKLNQMKQEAKEQSKVATAAPGQKGFVAEGYEVPTSLAESRSGQTRVYQTRSD